MSNEIDRSMTHLTFSIPDELYEEMKKHPEIKWSEVARKAIAKYLQQVKERSPSKEIFELLDDKTREKLKSITAEEAKRFYTQMVEAEWKRMKSSTQTS